MELLYGLDMGSHECLGFVHSKLKHHEGPLIYSTDIIFKNRQQRDIICLLEAWSKLRRGQGLESNINNHANFGGVTSAVHILSYKHVDPSVFTPPLVHPRVLAHIINAASTNTAKEFSKPPPLNNNIPRIPIKEGGILCQE